MTTLVARILPDTARKTTEEASALKSRLFYDNILKLDPFPSDFVFPFLDMARPYNELATLLNTYLSYDPQPI